MFRDLTIYPTHSTRSAIVAWRVDPLIKGAEFYVYKKMDGGGEWVLLNTDPVFGTTYADTEFAVLTKSQVPQYKVLGIFEGKEYISPEVAVYSHVSRKAFGVARSIIKGKYLQAKHDGIPVLYYPLVLNGKMSAALDDVTGQRLETHCNPTDYGTYYEQGYYPPFITFIRLHDPHVTRKTISELGTMESDQRKAEFLAFPPVRTGDLVVDVTTDRRWIVGEQVQADLVKSIVPVSYNAEIFLQSHSHPCYKVPIPANYFAMITQIPAV